MATKMILGVMLVATALALPALAAHANVDLPLLAGDADAAICVVVDPQNWEVRFSGRCPPEVGTDG